MKKTKAVFNWSGGKDSSLALYHLQKQESFDIHCLLTTINAKYDRISMHGVRSELLRAQGAALDLPIQEIHLPEMPSMSEYESIMTKTLLDLKKAGVSHSIFGDIFLEDLKKYREDRLAEVGLKGHFPIWKRDTRELIHEFIDLGFKSILVCIKSEALSKDFAGRVIDRDFLKDLPADVDPCGENGEFHTFVFDGPIFKKAIPIKRGEVIFREYAAPQDPDDSCLSDASSKPAAGFYFCDLILAEDSSKAVKKAKTEDRFS